jgi:hypothetical protein
MYGQNNREGRCQSRGITEHWRVEIFELVFKNHVKYMRVLAHAILRIQEGIGKATVSRNYWHIKTITLPTKKD